MSEQLEHEAELANFWREKAIYDQRTRDRTSAWISSGQGDTPFGERVNTEILIDVLERLKRLEGLVAPDEETTEEGKRKPRFF